MKIAEQKVHLALSTILVFSCVSGWSQEKKVFRDSARLPVDQVRISKMIEKYGEELGTKIANHVVEAGYTEKMCVDAWGWSAQSYNRYDPPKIDRREWYDGKKLNLSSDRSLFFKNDSLLWIQYLQVIK